MRNAKKFAISLSRRLLRRAVRFYYPVIEISGREKLPTEGAVLFVANHANSLVDPVVIGITARRPVRFLAKAPLFSLPVFGRLLYALGMVPVHRSQDDKSEMRKNIAALSEAANVLVAGDSLGIFPEGRSHDAVSVGKVRSGAARLALQAVENGATRVHLVPLGINYEEKEFSRSAIWVCVGDPIELCAWAKEHGTDRLAVRALTTEIQNQLRKAVVHLPNENWEPFLEDLETLVPAAGKGVAVIRQRKLLADAMAHYYEIEPEPTKALAQKIIAHRNELKTSGLTIQSDLFRLHGTQLFVRQFWDLLFFTVASIPAALGTVYNALPFIVSRSFASLLPQPGSMTVALSRLGFGIPVFLLWYAFGWWQLSGYFVPWAATVCNYIMVAFGILALYYWRSAGRFWMLWWYEFRMLFSIKKLRAYRREQKKLREELSQMVAAYSQSAKASTTKVASHQRPAYIAGALSVGFAIGALALTVLFTTIALRDPRPAELTQFGPALSAQDPSAIADTISQDEGSLYNIINGLQQLKLDVHQLNSTFQSGKRSFYNQQDDDAVRQMLFSYLSYQRELLHLIMYYKNYEQIKDSRLQLRALLLEAAAAATLFETAYHFVERFKDEPDAIRKLNEAEPNWDIPEGVYRTVQANLLNKKNREGLAAILEDYRRKLPAFEGSDLLQEYQAFHQLIQGLEHNKQVLDKDTMPQQTRLWFDDLLSVGSDIRYQGQAAVSTWVGSTRVRKPREGQSLIRETQLEELQEKVLPGDILIERQNWFLSRAFMPGYWAHAALYVGTKEQLQAMGLDDDPRVRPHLEKFLAPSPEGHHYVILEAVPQGVRMTTFEHCIGVADSAAVLRPRLSEEQKREAIARAFGHLGKPYDFEFDFFSSDKLVCTELVYRAYDGFLELPLVDVMGRMTLPPTELVRMYAKEQAAASQLEFVAFLDGDEASGSATFENNAELIASCQRPSLTWLQE